MDYIQVSLDTLKEIVEKADEYLGSTNGTVYFRAYKHTACWGVREKYYKHELISKPLEIEKGTFYETNKEHSQLVTEGTLKPLPEEVRRAKMKESAMKDTL